MDTCPLRPLQGHPTHHQRRSLKLLHHVILKQLNLRLVILAWRKGNVTLEILPTSRNSTSADEFRTALQPIIDFLEFKG